MPRAATKAKAAKTKAPTKPRARRTATNPKSRTTPQTGPGRPRKPPSRPEDQERELEVIRVEIAGAEADRTAAAADFRSRPLIAQKDAFLAAELRVAAAHAALCRATGHYTHALEFSKAVVKLAGQHAAAVEVKFADDLAVLEEKVSRDRAARAGAR